MPQRPNYSKQIQVKTLGFTWIYSSVSGLFNDLRRQKIKNSQNVPLPGEFRFSKLLFRKNQTTDSQFPQTQSPIPLSDGKTHQAEPLDPDRNFCVTTGDGASAAFF
jgi:hypothetical protein